MQTGILKIAVRHFVNETQMLSFTHLQTLIGIWVTLIQRAFSLKSD